MALGLADQRKTNRSQQPVRTGAREVELQEEQRKGRIERESRGVGARWVRYLREGKMRKRDKLRGKMAERGEERERGRGRERMRE